MSAESSEKLPVLEVQCPGCGGIGYRKGEDEDCHQCGGVGTVPTAFGEAVLELMDHNFRRMAKEHLRLNTV